MFGKRGAAAAVVLAMTAATVHADDLAKAREHYRNGTKAYELGAYDEAIREFSDAYRLKDDPVILFNIAQAHRLAGHTDEALRRYRMYLLKVPGAENRSEVERIIQELSSKPEPRTRLEDPDTERARRHFEAGTKHYEEQKYELAIKEFEEARRLRPAAAFEFNIGRAHDRLGHDPEALAAYERYVATTPAPDDAEEVRARIEVLKKRMTGKAAAPVAAPLPAAEPKPDARAGRTKKIAGAVVAVVGVAAIAAGIGMLVLAQNLGDELTADNRAERMFDAAKYRAAENDQIAGGVLLGVGGVAAVAGTIVAILGARQSSTARRTSVLPSVGPSTVAVEVGVRW